MTKFFLKLLKYALLLSALLAAFLAFFYPYASGTEGWRSRTPFTPNRTITDASLRDRFNGYEQKLSASAYEDTFKYLLEGYLSYRSPGGAYVYYPGAPSNNTRRVDGIEGFARFFPIAGAWLASGRAQSVQIGARSIAIPALLKEGLLAGTRVDGPEYWGAITSRTQRLVESSDIALGLWLTRKQIWENLAPTEKAQVTTWLTRALEVDTWPSNWLLFPITVHSVLKALGAPTCCHDIVVSGLYKQFKMLYQGGGWFDDPPNGYDYYNAWAIHYSLFWLDQIDPNFDPQFIRQSHSEFVGFYKHLMSPRGVPMMGRSVCYRMATPVPLLTAQVLAKDKVSAGVAMRALDSVWGHFVGAGALKDGAISQGYCAQDLSALDSYSGPASCLWSARSLLVALYLDSQLQLFDTAREPLPVQQADFKVEHPLLKWTVTGKQSSAEVLLTLTENSADYQAPYQRYGLKHQLLEWVTQNPRRPNNHDVMYKRRQFSSHQPIMGCTPG